jgi:hypothetical protein
MEKPATTAANLDSTISSTSQETRDKKLVLQIADVCFEMFSVRELRRPLVVLHELAVAFPEANSKDFQEAIQLAISWRLALKNIQGLTH